MVDLSHALAQEFRLAQAARQRDLSAVMALVWESELDVRAVQATEDAFVSAATNVVAAAHKGAVRDARTLHNRQAEAAGWTEPLTGVADIATDRQHIEERMRLQGPVGVTARSAGGTRGFAKHSPAEAARISQAETIREAKTIAANGARDQTAHLARSDRRVERLALVGRSGACELCQTLISRGAVYLAQDWEPHKGCNCQFETGFKPAPRVVKRPATTTAAATNRSHAKPGVTPNPAAAKVNSPSEYLLHLLDELAVATDPKRRATLLRAIVVTAKHQGFA